MSWGVRRYSLDVFQGPLCPLRKAGLTPKFEFRPAGNVEGEFGQEVGREVKKFEAEGEGKAGEYLAYVAAKMSGGVRKGGSSLGLLVVGLGMLAALEM